MGYTVHAQYIIYINISHLQIYYQTPEHLERKLYFLYFCKKVVKHLELHQMQVCNLMLITSFLIGISP